MVEINGVSPEALLIKEESEILSNILKSSEKTWNTTVKILKISIATLIISTIALVITFIHTY